MNTIKSYVNNRKKNEIKIAKTQIYALSWKELKENLQRFNMETEDEYREEYLHIHWSTLRVVISNYKPNDCVLVWKSLKHKLQNYNIDSDKKLECLHINWSSLKTALNEG